MRVLPLLLHVAALLAAASALAAWADFTPRPLDNGAYVDFYSSFERDDNRSGDRSSGWTDTYLRERVTVYSDGYSYHPRFLLYHLALSPALKQEDYNPTAGPSSGWNQKFGFEYDARFFLLPEHPYNLQLFSSRFEPLFREQAATQHDSVETLNGAEFRYRRKPYFLDVGFTDETVDTSGSSSDVRRVNIDGEYFKSFAGGKDVSFTASFNPRWFDQHGGSEPAPGASTDLSGSVTEYAVGNTINLQRVRLASSASQSSFEQHSDASGRLTNDQFSWYEYATAYLPWNFRADGQYRRNNNDSHVPDVSNGTTTHFSNDAEDIYADLVHRLYESVDTTYTFLRTKQTSDTGDTTSTSNGIALNYTKLIPRGRLLTGVNAARAETDSEGTPQVVGEQHPGTPVPGSFTLGQPNVAASSVVVFLRSPLPPFEAIELTENVDYIFVQTVNQLQIYVFTLPAEFVVPGRYDFFVSYELLAGTYTLQTDVYGGNASVEFLQNLLTPYVSYLAVRSKTLSGDPGFIPLDSTTYTAGLQLQVGPLRARGEYQRLDWDVGPYRSWRGELQYSAPVSPTVSVYATGSYMNRYYPHGTSETDRSPLTEQTAIVAGSVQKQLIARTLFLSGGGSYSFLKGLVDSSGYTVNGSLVWTIGKVDLSLGVNTYGSESSGSSTVSNNRNHQFVYFKLRRELF